MANQVDRYGSPILPAGLQQIVGSDNIPLRQRPFITLVSGATAVDNPDSNSTDLTFTGSAQNAAAAAFLAATTAVAEAELLGSEIPTAGTALTNANASITIAGGAQYVLPAATLTAGRVLTLGTGGTPLTGETLVVLRRDATAFTYTIQDDASTSLLVMPASVRMAAYFRYDGTHYVLSAAIRIQ